MYIIEEPPGTFIVRNFFRKTELLILQSTSVLIARPNRYRYYFLTEIQDYPFHSYVLKKILTEYFFIQSTAYSLPILFCYWDHSYEFNKVLTKYLY